MDFFVKSTQILYKCGSNTFNNARLFFFFFLFDTFLFTSLQDFKDFIEGAEHGVVLFALGISFIPKNVPREQGQMLTLLLYS
jgi:hypothetical protein